MAKVIFQFQHRGDKPTLQEVQTEFGLQEEEVDADYGVVLVSESRGLYVIQIEESAQAELQKRLQEKNPDADPTIGVFSNPSIEPTDPSL
jgi:hypothetical protein